MRRRDGWSESQTARLYDAFAQRFPMYLDTSVDLLDHLRIKQDAKVIDLACGTGVTTRAVLDRLGDNGRIWAVDASEPMLEIARRRIPDSRVNWRLGNALDLSRLVDHGVDDAVCNSAIWQLGPLDSLFPVVRSVLRSGAQFACNWGQGFVADPPPFASPRGLGALLTEVAHRRNLVDASRFREPSLPPSIKLCQRSRTPGSASWSDGGHHKRTRPKPVTNGGKSQSSAIGCLATFFRRPDARFLAKRGSCGIRSTIR